MRIICEKGFYKFYPQNIAEIARFQNKSKQELVECEDFFTFPILAALPNYSINTHLYSGGFPAFVTYAGKREEVMAQNHYTYWLKTNNLLRKEDVSSSLNYDISGNYIISNFLPQAYAEDKQFRPISGFSGFCDVDIMKYKIERFFYENI